MGIEIKIIDNTPDGNKRAQLLVESDNNFTSIINVQAGRHVNVGIKVGVEISDILSAATFSAAISQLTSVFSGIVTLQRRMNNETADYEWRNVEEWTISSSAAGEGGSENITVNPEPETVQYRAGTTSAAAAYVGGVAHIRIGTS